MVEIQESILVNRRDFNSRVRDSEIEELGYMETGVFLDSLLEDFMLMATYPEEPSEMNGEYITPNFEVLHTIVGHVDGEIHFGFGRITYNIVDIGYEGKKMVVLLNLIIEDGDEWGHVTEYSMEDYCHFLVSDGEYLDYLKTIEDESNII